VVQNRVHWSALVQTVINIDFHKSRQLRGRCRLCTMKRGVFVFVRWERPFNKDSRLKSCGGVKLCQLVNSWEAASSSETSVTIYLSTYSNITEDVTLPHHRCENLKCCYVHQFEAFLLICWIHGLLVVNLGYSRVHDVYNKLVAISTVIRIIYSKPTSLRQFLTLTIWRLTATIWVVRTANLQMLHFIHLFNKYTYRIF